MLEEHAVVKEQMVTNAYGGCRTPRSGRHIAPQTGMASMAARPRKPSSMAQMVIDEIILDGDIWDQARVRRSVL